MNLAPTTCEPTYSSFSLMIPIRCTCIAQVWIQVGGPSRDAISGLSRAVVDCSKPWSSRALHCDKGRHGRTSGDEVMRRTQRAMYKIPSRADELTQGKMRGNLYMRCIAFNIDNLSVLLRYSSILEPRNDTMLPNGPMIHVKRDQVFHIEARERASVTQS